MLIQKLQDFNAAGRQERLAELSGLSVRTIQRLEQGQTASVETLKALASVFETDFRRLKEPDMDTTQVPPLTPPLAPRRPRRRGAGPGPCAQAQGPSISTSPSTWW